MVPGSYRLLADTAIHWFPVNGRHSIIATPSSSPTFLEIVVQALRCPIVDDGIDLQVHPHAKSHSSKHHPHHTIWMQETLKDDVLVVLRGICVEHTKEPVITKVRGTWRIVGAVSNFIVEMGIQLCTHIQRLAVDEDTWSSNGFHSQTREHVI